MWVKSALAPALSNSGRGGLDPRQQVQRTPAAVLKRLVKPRMNANKRKCLRLNVIRVHSRLLHQPQSARHTEHPRSLSRFKNCEVARTSAITKPTMRIEQRAD